MEIEYSILPYLNCLSVTVLDVTFRPTKDLEQKAWLGAAVRNRFLFACEKVKLYNGMSLRAAFDVCPLDEQHFLYRQYAGGFPKCFTWDVSNIKTSLRGFRLKSEHAYTMSLLVFGTANSLITEIKEAIRHMMDLGLGSPVVALDLIDIQVHEPIRLENFATLCFDEPAKIIIQTRTPLSLLRNRDNATDGYQARLNGFPSLYQIVKSCVSRLVALNILYSESQNNWANVDSEEKLTKLIDNYANAATSAWITSASIKHETTYSTPKQGKDCVYRLSGYIGELTFDNVDNLLLPVIKMMGLLGIGNDVSYGLGFFDTIIE